ncbi:alpha-amylase [Flagellimonas sp. 389]|uniref:alpha-amylase n=1 Tax=Flagellimonas sp. 389 TaxID=2835862 RepID=UPI001BD359B9|nr:alpha-amylase [Flagellimonas sp. 389]MBS9464245.1 alpha-amylase [Flagellimonas sp. 389]
MKNPINSFFGSRTHIFIKGILTAYCVLLFSCSDSFDQPNGLVDEAVNNNEEVSEGQDLTAFLNGNGVMMQAFYWDVEPRFEWWDLIADKTDEWAAAGIDRIWLPPVSKGQAGEFSMGYDPSDYYDLGEYFQHGTLETRFGSREELDNLIAKAHENDIEVIADIVMGHNSGGGLEYNPYRDKDTYTLFNEENGNASGLFNRNYEDFHPNSVRESDEEALFFEEQDLSHVRENVQNWLWKFDNSVAKYYKNTVGFDGWRFDYVKSFSAEYVDAWVSEVGGWSVGEFFDGNANLVREWVAAAGVNAFDFPCLFQMRDAFSQNDLTILQNGDMLWKTNPEDAVTFVANHDTDREPVIEEEYKLYAYSYILTHPGYPTIFYLDYENEEFKQKLQQLILINRSIATGDVEVLYADEDEYIASRKGNGDNPGLVLYINTNGLELNRQVPTHWLDTELHDYTGGVTTSVSVDIDGVATLKAPANGYAVWSIK